ncbi:DUF4190 domain-containing protein [Candidatus Woesearchaeota archaeon]|nr:DUF4190 domain-containing protein [Candidatus Woesearchaeota archaeon]
MDKKRSSNAKISLILGLFFWVPLFNIILGLFAIYFAIRAMREIREGKLSGKYFALAGFFLGVIPYYFYLLYLLRTYFDIDAAVFGGISLGVPIFLIPFLLMALKKSKLL